MVLFRSPPEDQFSPPDTKPQPKNLWPQRRRLQLGTTYPTSTSWNKTGPPSKYQSTNHQSVLQQRTFQIRIQLQHRGQHQRPNATKNRSP